jgi:hypothetical protein
VEVDITLSLFHFDFLISKSKPVSFRALFFLFTSASNVIAGKNHTGSPVGNGANFMLMEGLVKVSPTIK